MKTIKTTLAALLVIAGILVTATIVPAADPAPSPTPVPVVVQGGSDLTLVAQNVPVAVVEGLRSYVVASGAFAFPPEQSGRPIKSLTIFVIGNKAQARIVLGPSPSPTP